MTLYALDAIDDAIDATRAFLWPIDLGRWAKLALVMFFVGGAGGGFNPLQFVSSPPTGFDGGPPGGIGELPAPGAPELTIILLIAGFVVLLALLLGMVGSIMEFVFVESLREEAVALRRYWGAHWGDGLWLFGFRIALGIVTLAVVAVIALAAFGPVLLGGAELSVVHLLLAVPLFVLVALVAGVVQGFTTVFVVPIMIVEDRGVLSAWGRLWRTMRTQWTQYATYLVMGAILQFATGVLASIVLLVLGIVVGIPMVGVGLVGAALLSVSGGLGWLLIGGAIVVFVLAVVVASLFVAVPLQAFLRYYALFVLGDSDEDLDLIPERRAAVRE